MNKYFKLNQVMPRFLPYPIFLLKTELNQTARELFALLLHRTTMSQLNGWTDGDGDVFVVYPIAEIAKDLNCSEPTVKRALQHLRDADLLECRRGNFNGASRLFIKLPKYQP